MVSRDARDRLPLLPVAPLEFLHETDQRVHALLGKGVVQRRPDPADRAVPFEAVEPGAVASLTNAFSRASLASRKVTFISDRSSFRAVPR